MTARCSTSSTIIFRFELRDICNADKFGLFFQQFQKKPLYLKGKCVPRLAAGSVIGEKLAKFVVSKSGSPSVSKVLKIYHTSTSLRRRA